MKRLTMFLSGAVIGAVLMFVALSYHIVRADDGCHLVPKVAARFGDTYVDIRNFDASDWDQHRNLAVAIVRADKQDLMKEAAGGALRRSVDNVLKTLSLPGDSP